MSKTEFSTMRSKIDLGGASNSAPCLVFIRGGTPGKVLELDLSKPYIVGRSSDCHLKIDDPTVSMMHAIIDDQQGCFIIKDLNSTNGTLVGGEPITLTENLVGGELISFGDVLMKFLLHGSAEHDYHRQLYDSVYRDSLTRVYNRRFLDENINHILHLHEQTSSKLALVVIDIDHFKKVNDVYGHTVGDNILRQTCSVLEQLLRKEDILVRYGGEEFVIIMTNTGPKYATKIARRLLSVCRRFDFQKSSEGPKQVTLSAGISFIDYAKSKYHASQANCLINEADEALYKAKALGRDRVVSTYQE